VSRADGGWSGDPFYPVRDSNSASTSHRRSKASTDAAVAARDAVRDYIAAHRDAYAGSWFEWSGDQARMTLGRTRDVERHRAELAPAIDLEARARSTRDLEEPQKFGARVHP
jgi:hypothetical protein